MPSHSSPPLPDLSADTASRFSPGFFHSLGMIYDLDSEREYSFGTGESLSPQYFGLANRLFEENPYPDLHQVIEAAKKANLPLLQVPGFVRHVIRCLIARDCRRYADALLKELYP